MLTPIARVRGRQSAVTRFCFRYRHARQHARLYDVLIVLDGTTRACRVEIRHAAAIIDDLPPLSSGRLSAARLRKAVSLLGLIERMTRNDRTANISGTLVDIIHLQSPHYSPRAKAVPKRTRVRDRRERRPCPLHRTRRYAPSQGGVPLFSCEAVSLALPRTSYLLARARHRYRVGLP
jgi:hypothetical protein